MQDEVNDSVEQIAAATETGPAESADVKELQRQRDEYYDRLRGRPRNSTITASASSATGCSSLMPLPPTF